MKKRDVALVLASGGSRGLAHIGAIDVLLKNGFNITSVSGTSMGALVGGLYAAGGLGVFKEWMKSVDKMKVFSLMDFTLSTEGFVKGEKIINELKTLVPDINIEDLPIPYTAVATDIRHRREVVFDRGPLFEAIRSSISIPSLFTPHKIGNMILIDGGVINPIPLNRVPRKEGDMIVAIDLNAPYIEKPETVDEAAEAAAEDEKEPGIIRRKFEELVERFHKEDVPENPEEEDMSIVSILNESSSLMIQTNSERTIELYRPDLLVSIAKNAYSTLEFFKYDEIVELGRQKTIEALATQGLL